jgi:hypothetical protein
MQDISWLLVSGSMEQNKKLLTTNPAEQSSKKHATCNEENQKRIPLQMFFFVKRRQKDHVAVHELDNTEQEQELQKRTNYSKLPNV